MIIIARNSGQLGNRLFLYAHFIAASREYGFRLANPGFAEYAHFFPSTAGDLWCRYPRCPPRRIPPSLRSRRMVSNTVSFATRALATCGLVRFPFQVIRIRGEQTFDLGSDQFADLARSQRHLLTLGWLFRSETLLQKHADAVRDHFRIAPQHHEPVNQIIDSIRQRFDVVVGVHIRHGDYAKFLDGKYFYSIPQYVRAMREIEQQLPGRRVAFLVCSNVMVDQRAFGDLQVQMGPGHLIEDMYAMARADLLVGPPSTYTGWASFYGQVPLLAMHTADAPLKVPAKCLTRENRVA